MKCAACQAELSDDAESCGACGQVVVASDVARERPAHLAMLDAAGSAQTSERPAKPRLVSQAGPAMPVPSTRPADDAVPSGASAAGWMARLEQAKRGGGAEGPPPLPRAASSATTASGASPPPLPPPLPRKSEPAAKPAHLLVAELEAAEREKRAAKARGAALGSAGDEISNSEIANVEIPKPETEIAERHVPKWVYFVALIVVLGGIAGAYWWAEKKTPVVVAEADPELRAKAERARNANAAVEEGHGLLGDKKDPAKIELAIAAYQRALGIDPKFARAERALGVAFAAKGDDASAALHYRRFLELEPDAPEAPQVRAILQKYEAKTKK